MLARAALSHGPDSPWRTQSPPWLCAPGRLARFRMAKGRSGIGRLELRGYQHVIPSPEHLGERHPRRRSRHPGASRGPTLWIAPGDPPEIPLGPRGRRGAAIPNTMPCGFGQRVSLTKRGRPWRGRVATPPAVRWARRSGCGVLNHSMPSGNSGAWMVGRGRDAMASIRLWVGRMKPCEEGKGNGISGSRERWSVSRRRYVPPTASTWKGTSIPRVSVAACSQTVGAHPISWRTQQGGAGKRRRGNRSLDDTVCL